MKRLACIGLLFAAALGGCSAMSASNPATQRNPWDANPQYEQAVRLRMMLSLVFDQRPATQRS